MVKTRPKVYPPNDLPGLVMMMMMMMMMMMTLMAMMMTSPALNLVCKTRGAIGSIGGDNREGLAYA